MSLLPQISDSVVAFVRVGYGVLLLGTIIGMLPSARRFFLSERWGGYARSSPGVDVVHNPVVMPIALALWLACAALLVVGQWVVAAAAVNVLLARYFCIWMRWRGVLRGLGAPGFMTYWLAVAVFVLEGTTHYAPSLRPLGLLALQLDLGFVFLAAAVYKLRSGYPRNHGMELGLANPQWGYWWQRYRRLDPGHPLFRALNQLAWSTELAAAIGMLVPPLRFFGGVILIVTFAVIATQIRLALLCEMVMLAGVLFFDPASVGGRLIDTVVAAPGAAPASALPPEALAVLAALLGAYVILLPFAYLGLAYNLYVHRTLPAALQGLLERYTNAFGITLWRVFSADLVNFTIRMHRQPEAGGARQLVSDYRSRLFSRFSHVCEMIAITSVFTTLKYYPSDSALFVERIVRYARTIPVSAHELVVFEYLSLRGNGAAFEYAPTAEFTVDPRRGEVVERVIDASAPLRTGTEHSPIHEGLRPGSYAPRR